MNNAEQTIVIPGEVEAILSTCASLPSLPAVVFKIIDACKAPDIGVAEVSELIRLDPALSAKVLKVANSPMYSLRREIHNLREALSLLGLNAALTIALSFSLFRALNEGREKELEQYWKRSILAATIARHIGHKLGLNKLEDLFLAGLLQDIGMLALDCAAEELGLGRDASVLSHDERLEMERDALGVDHASIGAWLLQSWRLPEKLYQAVLHSHGMEVEGREEDREKAFRYCVALSGELADIWINENSENGLEEILSGAQSLLAYDRLELESFVEEINALLPDISSLFEIKVVDERVRDKVLEESRTLMMERSLEAIKKYDEAKQLLDSISAKHKSMEEESRYDDLTGVFNRKHVYALMEEEFKAARQSQEPFSVAFIDVDYFKAVNDKYGHLAGDEVLQKIAQFFSQNIRRSDILARYGGDEFVLLLPGAGSDIAASTLGRLIRNFKNSSPIEMGGEPITPTVSIGLATHGDGQNFDSVEDLLNAADQALYKAKDAGRNTLIVDSCTALS